MDLYHTLSTWNEKRLQGCAIGEEEQAKSLAVFLHGASAPAKSARYMAGAERAMYPLFYIPPGNNGAKLRLLTGELPKTQLLSANHYELEILHLLALSARGNEQVEEMLEKTAQRLEKTCFGCFCDTGECVGATISSLRFWSAYRPADVARQERILTRFRASHDETGRWKSRFNIPMFYYWLTLSELRIPLAVEEIAVSQSRLLALLRRGWLVAETGADSYNVKLKYVVRNTLARLPEFAHLRQAEIYIGADGRCYCDVPQLQLVQPV